MPPRQNKRNMFYKRNHQDNSCLKCLDIWIVSLFCMYKSLWYNTYGNITTRKQTDDANVHFSVTKKQDIPQLLYQGQ